MNTCNKNVTKNVVTVNLLQWKIFHEGDLPPSNFQKLTPLYQSDYCT